jgi:hypothetical protein
MPREAIRRGGAQQVAPNWAIADEIIKAVEKQPQTNTDKPGRMPQTHTKKYELEEVEKWGGLEDEKTVG